MALAAFISAAALAAFPFELKDERYEFSLVFDTPVSVCLCAAYTHCPVGFLGMGEGWFEIQISGHRFWTETRKYTDQIELNGAPIKIRFGMNATTNTCVEKAAGEPTIFSLTRLEGNRATIVYH